MGPSAPSAAILPREAQLAVFNALKIGGSLLATWSIALFIRFALPRHLGPELYGAYNFAEAFALSFFVLATLGLDTYIQKEVSVRAEHASQFFGGVTVLRLFIGLLLLALMELLLWRAGRPVEIRRVVLLFGLGQFFFLTNASLSTLLQAQGTVDGLSWANVAGKLLWGALVLLGLLQLRGLAFLALAFLFAELAKGAVLLRLCQKHLGLRLGVDLRAAREVALASAPFFLTTIALTLYTRLDLTLISFLAGDREVGFYAAASNLAGLALLFTPLISSVLMPLFARAASRSPEELGLSLRRSAELVLTLAIPVSLALFLGAELWIRLASGEAFARSAPALRVLAPQFILTYGAMLCASGLNLLGRAWTVTWVCLGGLVVNPALNLWLIPWAQRRWGEGGAGVGAAFATVATEGLILLALAISVGKLLLDRRLVAAVGKSLFASALLLGLHPLALGLGRFRLPLEGLLYCALLLLLGAIRPGELRDFLRSARSARSGADGC